MKNLELELSGVQSLNSEELKSVDGGMLAFNWGAFWRGVAIGGAAGVGGASLALAHEYA